LVPEKPSQAAESCGPLAFDKPSVSKLRSAKRKAFAFYFPPFPISVENKPPASDYYSQWLNTGDTTGRYDLRDRPIPRPVQSCSTWKQKDFETEVRQAIAIGLDGFIWEFHVNATDQRWNQLPAMLAAVEAVDPGFRIMLSPDITDTMVADIAKLKDEPALFRVDGAIVLAPFYPERKSVSYWDDIRNSLASQGVKTSLVPLFLDGPPSARAAEWNNSVIGYSHWGSAWAGSADGRARCTEQSHAQGRIYLSPIVFEDTRSYSGQCWESGNSSTLRATLEKSIEAGADWLYFRTWNDYTEAWMAPSTERGTSVGDVAAYYVTWFKTGKRPTLNRDALYYFHRSHHTLLPYDTARQKTPMKVVQGDPAANQVELLAFLAAPGTLIITQGSVRETLEAQAGVVSFKVAIKPGTTPTFELRRAGRAVQSLQSATPIRTRITLQDWMYHGGGGTKLPRCDP